MYILHTLLYTYYIVYGFSNFKYTLCIAQLMGLFINEKAQVLLLFEFLLLIIESCRKPSASLFIFFQYFFIVLCIVKVFIVPHLFAVVALLQLAISQKAKNSQRRLSAGSVARPLSLPLSLSLAGGRAA